MTICGVLMTQHYYYMKILTPQVSRLKLLRKYFRLFPFLFICVLEVPSPVGESKVFQEENGEVDVSWLRLTKIEHKLRHRWRHEILRHYEQVTGMNDAGAIPLYDRYSCRVSHFMLAASLTAMLCQTGKLLRLNHSHSLCRHLLLQPIRHVRCGKLGHYKAHQVSQSD